jgi:hypothetical protein
VAAVLPARSTGTATGSIVGVVDDVVVGLDVLVLAAVLSGGSDDAEGVVPQPLANANAAITPTILLPAMATSIPPPVRPM